MNDHKCANIVFENIRCGNYENAEYGEEDKENESDLNENDSYHQIPEDVVEDFSTYDAPSFYYDYI